MRTHPTTERLRVRAAFTLVETTLAVGIVATVLLTVVSLIPAAINAQRNANRINTETRIVQALVGQVQLCNWDDIDTTFATVHHRTHFFDDQGTLVSTPGNHVYSTRIYLTPAQLPSLTSPELPGDSNLPLPTPREEHLRRVAIHVTAVPGDLGLGILDDITDKRVSRLTVDVVNLRKR